MPKLILVLLSLPGILFAKQAQKKNGKALIPVLEKTDFVTGLQGPWDLAFDSAGAMFFTEKCRGLSVRKKDGSIVRLFGTVGSAVVAPDFFCEGQSGMNGVALAPDFTTSRELFVYMPSSLSNPKTNRVVKLTVNPGYSSVFHRQDIVTDISFKNEANNWGGAGTHSGGRIRFGPDGFLYIPTGDNHNGSLPQDLKKLGGKVLRVTRDGKAAPKNNSPAGADTRIFTYGHRNVQGLSFRPGTGQAYICEHGPNHSDEVTPLVAGGNGGWDPRPEEGVTCEDNYCGYVSNKRSGLPTPMTDLEKYPQALHPLVVYPDSMGLSPCTFISGAKWKDWNGALLVGMLSGQKIEVLKLGPQGELAGKFSAPLPAARIRALVQGVDGNLYVATDGGSIWKVVPK